MRKTPSSYARSLYVALSATPAKGQAGVIRGFLKELARTRKTALRPRIVHAFTRLALAAEGKRVASVTTARALDTATRARLEKAHPDAVIEERIDTALIGGAVIRSADTLIDGSVRGRLDGLKRALST